MELTVTYDGPDIGKFAQKLRKNMTKSFTVLGRRLAGKGSYGLSSHLIRHSAGEYPPNSPVWKRGKNGKKLFYNTGAFRNSPQFEVIPPAGDVIASVKVGIISGTHPSGVPNTLIARTLVSNISYVPTIYQRRAFWNKVKDNLSPNFKVTPSATYNNPARDFITKHLLSLEVRNLVLTYVDKAVFLTFKTRIKKKL